MELLSAVPLGIPPSSSPPSIHYQKLQEAREVMLQATNESQDDDRDTNQVYDFRPDDMVFVKTINPSKWEPRFVGPARVIRQVSPTIVRIVLEDMEEDIHINRLKRLTV